MDERISKRLTATRAKETLVALVGLIRSQLRRKKLYA